ncbi:MAG TPA: response regulator transcription factor [Thermoleophilaceae bacterium]|nr:response regulator transcription factor [Thermoleophilaceae bacterium]
MRSIVVVADRSLVVETIRLGLRAASELRVVGKLDGQEPIRQAIRHRRPDIVLVDEMDGSEAALERIRECREEAPAAAILLLTLPLDEATVRRALSAGADACLSKSAHLRGLGTLVREVVNRNVVSALPSGAAADQLTLDGKEELTAREREILTLVADGLTNARIARQLWVTEQTVKFHLSNTYRKLGVANRTEASRYVNMPGLAKRLGPRLVPSPPAG